MTRSKVLFLCAVLLGISACGQNGALNTASAQETSIVENAVDTPAPSTALWTVVAEQSHIKFTAEQEGKPFTGEFTVFDAEIYFDAANLPSSNVTVTVPLNQVEAGSNDRNATLPGKVWFSSKKFPEAVFQSSDISKVDEGNYLAVGTLSLKGISKPFELPFALTMGDEALMTSQISLDRTIWNVGEDPWHTDDWVSKDVTLDIQVTAKR